MDLRLDNASEERSTLSRFSVVILNLFGGVWGREQVVPSAIIRSSVQGTNRDPVERGGKMRYRKRDLGDSNLSCGVNVVGTTGTLRELRKD